MKPKEPVIKAATSSMECSVNSTHQRLKRGLNGLATIGSTAPFVGLFGTVIGIIHSFRGSTTTPDRYLSSSAGGISEALITTGLGLAVAVPAVWANNYFSGKVETFDREMDEAVDATSTYLCGVRAAQKTP